MTKMRKIICKKCGAVNNSKNSKHVSFVMQGKLCCGHCGNVQ